MSSASFHSHFVDGNTQMKFSTREKKSGKELEVFISIMKNQDSSWAVEATLQLGESLTKFDPLIMKKGDVKFVGIWDDIYAKKGVSMDSDHEISPSDLGFFENETLFELIAFANGIQVVTPIPGIHGEISKE